VFETIVEGRSAGLEAGQPGMIARGTPCRQNTRHDSIRAFWSFVIRLVGYGHFSIGHKEVRAIRFPMSTMR